MRRLRILHPLRERDFALFQTGSIVSLIGDGLFMVAIAWQVYDIWNVPTALAIVGGDLLASGVRRPERPPAGAHGC